MQKIKHLQLGMEYVISGKRVTVNYIKTYAGELFGLQKVELSDKQGHRFVLNQWPDGSIYRISQVTEN
jgi:hypothetical protein